MSINASCLGLCRISAALAHLQSAGVGWNINSQMVFVGDGALSQHMRTVFLGLSDCMLGVSANIEISVCNMLLSPESSISNKLMNNDIQPNTNDWCLCHDNSIMRSHLLKCLHKISKQARNKKVFL